MGIRMTKDDWYITKGTYEGYDSYKRPYWKKAEFLKYHTEEEWVEIQKKSYKNYKKWAEKNPDKVAESNKHNNKDVYIAKNGQDAYDEKLKKRRELWAEKKDELNAKQRERRKDNIEYYRERDREYYRTHPDVIRRAEEKRKEKKKEYAMNRKGTIRHRASVCINDYKKMDSQKGFETNMTIDGIIELWNDGCIYCGEKDWRKLGADRIDNNKGHTMDNVVCACTKCNRERRNMPFKLFRFLKMHPNICDDDYEIVLKSA